MKLEIRDEGGLVLASHVRHVDPATAPQGRPLSAYCQHMQRASMSGLQTDINIFQLHNCCARTNWPSQFDLMVLCAGNTDPNQHSPW